MIVNPGTLKKKIKIVHFDVTKNENGFGANHEERIVRETYARFSRTSGTETVKAGADFTTVNVRFLIRKSKTDIDQSMKVRYKEDLYEIKFMNEYEDSGEYVELICEVMKSGDD